MGFLRVTDAAELIGYSRPTLQKLIDRGLVREVALFPENPNAPRFVSVSDLLRLPAVALRLTTDGEVVRRRARPWEE